MNLASTLQEGGNGHLTKEAIAEGLLVGRKVIGLTKAERYRLRCAVETLMAQGHTLNAILQICDTTREFYFCQVDTIKTPPEETPPPSSAKQERKAQTKRMTYEEKLRAIDNVDRLRYVEGLLLQDACERSGVRIQKYYQWTLNRPAILRAIAQGRGKECDEPKRRRRKRIPDTTTHEERLAYIERARRQINEGVSLKRILNKDNTPRRLYTKWANEKDRADVPDENPDEVSPVLNAWIEFEQDKTNLSARNALIRHYMPLVRTEAEKMSLNLPAFVDVRDLEQEGTFGLCDALEDFNTRRGTKFRYFATFRIRGAILDYLRIEDVLSRTDRQKVNGVKTATQIYFEKNGRLPTPEEILQTTQSASPEEPAPSVFPPTGPHITSLNRTVEPDQDYEKPVSLAELLIDQNAVAPMNRQEKMDLLRQVTRNLTKEEKLVIIGYYYEYMTMKEIGEMLDLSASRISQMHTAIIGRLTAMFNGRREEVALS
ncbi:MAG: sigma-70 family RNA polymerase sigma factor [Candidatus Peribacteraceae bacterium]|nr:sigma-70 family RNA polymerase sigma factor [Candidatus Peribacteraceae bacterium]MDD5075328.1 sigma-70 family RNA polymerase sigma factor [Candidatus Peribacteraceae bacterium]